jgi:hypothetical protein
MHCIANAMTLPHSDGLYMRIWMPKPGECYDIAIEDFAEQMKPGNVLLVFPGAIDVESHDWDNLLDSILFFAPDWLYVHIWTRPGIYTYRRWQPCGCNDCINFRCNLH